MPCNLNKHICITYLYHIKYMVYQISKIHLYIHHTKCILYIYYVHRTYIGFIPHFPTTSKPNKAHKSPRTQLSTSSHSPPRPRRLSDASSALESHEAEAGGKSPPFLKSMSVSTKILGFWKISICCVVEELICVDFSWEVGVQKKNAHNFEGRSF